ncbi:MAG TPA: DMT family transporter [Pseudonocardia sp.]|nr:DMT family transporter [Pseudonocardia sp.]
MAVVAAGLALLAALLFAVGSAAQQRAASLVPDEDARGLRLIRVLVRRRLWWVGSLGDAGGFVVQAAALGFGSLLLVQPLLTTTLLFALPLGAWWAGRRLERTDWVWAGLLSVALAVFVVVGRPTAGLSRAPLAQWLPAVAVLGVLLVACLLGAATRRGTPRAVLLAAATALAYGAVAPLMKGVVSELGDGVGAVLSAWETYGLAAATFGGTMMQQSAFQAGGLGASMPTVAVGEPVVAVVLGVTVLGEQVRSSGPTWVLIAVLAAVMVVATAALAHSAARASGPVPPVRIGR